MPRGGRRVGSGRKPKLGVAATGMVIRHPSSRMAPPTPNGLPPVEEFDVPDDLSCEERQVWMKQAPYAFQHRTLTRATALAFERYCKIVVLERNEAKSSGVGGPNHRGLLKQINAYELQFMLMPCGKPMPQPLPTTAADEDDAFFGGSSSAGSGSA